MTLTESRVALSVRPLSRTIGAVVRGVDLRNPSDAEVAALREHLLDRAVLFFPAQHLAPRDHVALAGRFGEPTASHPVIPGVEGFPELFEIDYTAARRYPGHDANGGVGWHTDVTFVERPPLGSILNAVVIPHSGGDTMFSDQRAAFAALSPSLQGYLRTLRAVHSGQAQFGRLLERQERGNEWDGEQVTRLDPVVHPVVRTHPETGQESLFVNPGFTQHVEGLTADESATLLGFLFAHSIRPEFTVRYQWQAGDLAFWDNRVTQHAVVGDFGDSHRVIQRVTLRGDVPA